MERVLDEISFTASDQDAGPVVVRADYVRAQLEDISANEDLSRYIL